MEIPQAENIPKAPNGSKIGNKSIFKLLNTPESLINAYLADLFDIKMLFSKVLRTQVRVNIKKRSIKTKFSLIKIRGGDQILNPDINMTTKIKENILDIVKQELIISLASFLVVSGKNLISPIPNPRLPNIANRSIDEMIADASPTSSVG